MSSATETTLSTVIARWLNTGLDRERGGFVEALDLTGVPAETPFKRTRVTGRQIYVFSHCAMMGLGDFAAAAEHGVAFLMNYHRGDEPGRWHRRVDPWGRPLDPTADLYDVAFVLFALAWWHRLSGDPEAIALAKATLGFIDRALAHPSGRGYRPAADAASFDQQNPHMHLLEALVEWFDATGDDYFLARADALVDLFETRFLVGGTLREYFASDWSPAAGLDGRKVEPGHMCEWAWLIARYGRARGRDVADRVSQLVSFARRAGGQRPDGLLEDVVLDDGSRHERSVRLWPQTELIKGLIALAEATGADVSADVARAEAGLKHTFLDPAPAGCWFDHFDADGKLIVGKIPASSLYHLVLAAAEVRRFKAASPRPGGPVTAGPLST